MSHKMCPRKLTTEPKLLIVVSFFSGQVTSYTDTSYCIHILWEVYHSFFFLFFLGGPPCRTASLTMAILYAVKVQRSLSPLSRFCGSHITTVHEQQCCRFQSYANSVPSPMKLTKREPHSWDPRQRTTWSRLVTSDFNSVYWPEVTNVGWI